LGCRVGIAYQAADRPNVRPDDRSCNSSDVISSDSIERVGGVELSRDGKRAVERRKIKIEGVRVAGVVAFGEGQGIAGGGSCEVT
jgi:hypothetical protein